MCAGGIYDHVGGGFHRYATDACWRVPHFEKMLYDQALLVPVYLEAYLYSQNTRYREVVEETLDYVIEYLRHEDGGSTRQKMRIVKVLKVPFISGVHPILTTY